jgi:FixJ family two-component response regulator
MLHLAPIVFVVDDDVSVRESLELLIRCKDCKPETFASAQEFLDYPRVLVPKYLVLDVSLPGLNGLDLQRFVSGDGMDMPIIFITGYGGVPMTVQAVKAGAAEFLTKPLHDDVPLTALGAAPERSRVALSLEAEMRALRNRYASVTQREQVMALVVSGLLNKQVGGGLGISEITVRAHRGKMMQKMKADSLADVVNGGEAPLRTRSGCGGVTALFTVAIIREDAEFADARKTFTPHRMSSWRSMEVET